MSAKEQIRDLIDGLTEAECQRLLDGVDVYGPGAFDLDISSFVDAAREREPGEPRGGDVFIKDAGMWMRGPKRTDTPILNRLRGMR
jgi:hypothetical protein